MTKPSDIRPKKPTTAVQAMQAAAESEKQAAVKKPFVRKPHLTQRPFHNESLVSLRAGLRKSANVKQG